ncbi:hypothetical protein CK203_038878 [Vitis vinifera]|uniref:Uncharacterized protein n=1 Tax=Vitis vinifera TaxID=29760 RepID=A0A438HFX6_VITVI|nr:hypothetical protein CK203_038878 [Vitis vinifera]
MALFIELTDGEAVSTEKLKTTLSSFPMSNSMLGSGSPSRHCSRNSFTSLRFLQLTIHPNMVRVLMGCSILSMLFNLDLSLLEVLFIYSIKKVKNDIFSFVASLPSLQLVTSLFGLDQGGRQGSCAGQGPMGGLFEIAAVERSCETLLSAQNLHLVIQEPQPYMLNILPRRLPKEVVAGEHFVLKDLPFYAAVRKADTQSRKARLNKREEKRQEGLLRKAPGNKCPASSPPAGAPAKKKKKGVTIRTPDPSVLPSVSSGSGCLAGLNHSGPSMPAAGRLALLAEEATSKRGCKLGLPPYEPSSLAFVPVKGPATRRSRPARDLKFGLIGRLQDRFLETIEVSCSFRPGESS